MRNIRKILAAAVLVAAALPASAQIAASVHDPLNFTANWGNWMSAIDTLYQNYDLVMNSITNIENQWTQIQKAVENARSIDWDNIRFDGDFDIRNDIRDANRRVNRLLTDVRKVRDSLSANVIQIPGGASYSLADLCGAGKEGENIFTAGQNVMRYMSDNMRRAAEQAAGKLNPKQRVAIMAKYGISPANYIMVCEAETLMRKQITDAIAYSQEQTKVAEAQAKEIYLNTVIAAAFETLDSDGNMTQGAANEANIHLLKALHEQLGDLTASMRDATGLIGSQKMAEMAQQEAAAQAEAARDEMEQHVDTGRSIRYRAFAK